MPPGSVHPGWEDHPFPNIHREKGLLPEETAEYVPKFLALAKICSYPGRYGLTMAWEESVVWDRVKLKS
ncbi:unnamed protein product, partial [marine sediment metagenome]